MTISLMIAISPSCRFQFNYSDNERFAFIEFFLFQVSSLERRIVFDGILLLQIDRELERRRELGFDFLQVVNKQGDIFEGDNKAREAHQVAFMAQQREAARILKDYSQSRGKEDQDAQDDFDENLQHR